MPGKGALERARHAGIPDAIPIGLGRRRKPRVEGFGNALGGHHPDRSRKTRIQRANQRLTLDRALERKTGDLAQRVHPGVGPSGAGDAHRALIELCQHLFEQALDRRARRLPLPADEVRAVVGEGDLEGAHDATNRRRRELTPADRTRWIVLAFVPVTRLDRRPRPGLHHRQSLRAQRTGLGLVGWQRHVEQRVKRHLEADAAAASIDDRRGADDAGARRGCHLHRFTRRSARRQHVLDHQHTIAVGDRKPAPQREPAVLPFGKDRAHTQRASHLVADDDAAERRRQDDGRRQVAGAPGDRPPERLGVRADAAAPARTAGNPGCADRRSGGNGRRAMPPTFETARAAPHDSCSRSIHFGFRPNRTRPATVYSSEPIGFPSRSGVSCPSDFLSRWRQRCCMSSDAFAQTSLTTPAQAPPAAVRRLSVDEAVKLALEQNLGIQIERLNPQIQDVAVAQARSFWVPNFTSSFFNNSTNNPPTSALSGGQSKITDSRLSTSVGLNQVLPTGANYSFGWNSARATSTNAFSNFDPILQSNVSLNVTQPLLRDFKIDNIRQQLEISKKSRETADVQLHSAIVQTTRNVKNAYWDLAFQVNNLAAQRQSLQLAQRLLRDNERRVQIGTMAPIDIVEAQSEVARNDESVIVAEAAIKSAEDRLRALIYDPAMPDFWTITHRAGRHRAVSRPGGRCRCRGAQRARQTHRPPAGEEQPGAERCEPPLFPEPAPARRQRHGQLQHRRSRRRRAAAVDVHSARSGRTGDPLATELRLGPRRCLHQPVPDLDGGHPGRLSDGHQHPADQPRAGAGCSTRRRRRSSGTSSCRS